MWTNEIVTNGTASVINYGSQGMSTGVDGTTLHRRSRETHEEIRVEPGDGIETVDLRHGD